MLCYVSVASCFPHGQLPAALGPASYSKSGVPVARFDFAWRRSTPLRARWPITPASRASWSSSRCSRSRAIGVSALSLVTSRSTCSQHPRPAHLLEPSAAGANLWLLLLRRRPRRSTALRSASLSTQGRPAATRPSRQQAATRPSRQQAATSLRSTTSLVLHASVVRRGARLRSRRRCCRCRRAWSQAPRLSHLRLCLAQRLWLCHQGLAWPRRNGGRPSDHRARSAWRWTSPPPPPPRQDLPLLSKLDLRTCTCPRSRTRTSPCRRRSSRTTSTTSIHGCARLPRAPRDIVSTFCSGARLLDGG